MSRQNSFKHLILAMSQDAWSPKQYDKFKAERSQPFFDLLQMVQLPPDSSVVDLGCGTGELTAELHGRLRAQQTLGIDNSAEMLKVAFDLKVDRLSFQQTVIERFQATSEYDLVFSNAALQWCADHPQLFKKIATALKPNGQLAVQMPMNHDYVTHTLARQMSEEEPWRSLLGDQTYQQKSHLLDVESYAQLLFDLGFREQKVDLRVYGHVLESREQVIEWVKGTLLTHFKSRLPEEKYQRFLGDFRERLFSRLADVRPFFYPFKRILLWAKK